VWRAAVRLPRALPDRFVREWRVPTFSPGLSAMIAPAALLRWPPELFTAHATL
jgi:hypothetical protein